MASPVINQHPALDAPKVGMLAPRPHIGERLFKCHHFTRLIRIAKLYGSTRLPLRHITESFSDAAMTGTFRFLPPELVDCIITALLTIDPRKPPPCVTEAFGFG